MPNALVFVVSEIHINFRLPLTALTISKFNQVPTAKHLENDVDFRESQK